MKIFAVFVFTLLLLSIKNAAGDTGRFTGT